ncbi:MAG: inositol monophosphatase family protein [Planctomycetota bacterium]
MNETNWPAELASPEARLAVAREGERIAREAGAGLMEKLGRLDAGDVRTKSARRDLVTVADVEAERLIVERLRRAFPGHAIEAEEETRDAPDDARPRWFVDPLDGTVNFVHQLPAFAVSLGLYLGREPVAGVVHAPRLEETFVAATGAGAWSATGRLAVSETEELADAILATGFPYRRNELPNNNLSNFDRLFGQVRGMRRMGSAAIDLAYVAAGRIDAYWELHLDPHDLAAGACLVREAGGRVSDTEGGEEWLRGGRVVAGPAALHRALVAQVDGS